MNSKHLPIPTAQRHLRLRNIWWRRGHVITFYPHYSSFFPTNQILPLVFLGIIYYLLYHTIHQMFLLFFSIQAYGKIAFPCPLKGRCDHVICLDK
jgi:hypothetical protein